MSKSAPISATYWPYPRLFAHRGGGSLAPENTIAAMAVGQAHRYTAVEFDVKLTSDGFAIIMHDATLERTTNGHGLVAKSSIADIEALDAGSWHGVAYANERVPRFSVLAKFLQSRGMVANVEIKPCPGREVETGERVAQLTVELWAGHHIQPLVSSFSLAALRAARRVAPQLPIGLLVETPDESHWQLLEELGCVSLECDHQSMSAEWVARLHAKKYRSLCYTVNDPVRAAALFATGVDGLFTDNLLEMAEQFPDALATDNRPMHDTVKEPPIVQVMWPEGAIPPMP